MLLLGQCFRLCLQQNRRPLQHRFHLQHRRSNHRRWAHRQEHLRRRSHHRIRALTHRYRPRPRHKRPSRMRHPLLCPLRLLVGRRLHSRHLRVLPPRRKALFRRLRHPVCPLHSRGTFHRHNRLRCLCHLTVLDARVVPSNHQQTRQPRASGSATFRCSFGAKTTKKRVRKNRIKHRKSKQLRRNWKRTSNQRSRLPRTS